MFTKEERSGFRYWFAHWCAFQMTALNLKCWKPKYLSHRWNNIERLDKKYAAKYTDVDTLMKELYNNYYGKIVKKYCYHDELSSHFRCLTKALIMTERRKLGLDKNSTKF